LTRFQVLASIDEDPVVGESVVLLMWANRSARAIHYQWTVSSAPPGSDAKVLHPSGVATISTCFNYHYPKDRQAMFEPDMPGTYVLTLEADLAFSDELFPDQRMGTSKLTLVVASNASQGCSTSGPHDLVGLLVLLVWAAARRRRHI
jgi:uncharacterized protein (TIGR03382 family)